MKGLLENADAVCFSVYLAWQPGETGLTVLLVDIIAFSVPTRANSCVLL